MQWATPNMLEQAINALRKEFAVNAYKNLKILSLDNKFIFEVDYDYIDYKYAIDYFNTNETPIEGKCSGCRKNNLIGRNLDWNYNNDGTFIIRVPRIDDRYASIGTCFKTGFNADVIRSRKYNELYKILPFYTVDGINEFGLYCQTNVVPVADNPKPTTKTGIKGQPELSMHMVCRWVLDHYKTATEAVNALKNDCRICAAKQFSEAGFETHWFICDINNSYIVEVINNEVIINDVSAYPIMTNFYVSNIIRNADGSLYSIKDNVEGQECKATTINKLGLYADGIERYNILNAGLTTVSDVDDMFDLMGSINYTKNYTEIDVENPDKTKIWYSENTGPAIQGKYKVTNEWTPEQFEPYLKIIVEGYENRSRETGETWQTVHQCVYDLVNKKFYLKSQQNELEDKIYEIELIVE